MFGVLAELIEDVQNEILMMIDRVSTVQNPQEDVLKEDNNLLLQMLPEMKEQAVEDTE
jgi:hypothetical protein